MAHTFACVCAWSLLASPSTPLPFPVVHEVETANAAKDNVLRELGEASARVSRSAEEWRKLSKAVGSLEAELDAERKKRSVLGSGAVGCLGAL